jgi:hypothetical protein
MNFFFAFSCCSLLLVFVSSLSQSIIQFIAIIHGGPHKTASTPIQKKLRNFDEVMHENKIQYRNITLFTTSLFYRYLINYSSFLNESVLNYNQSKIILEDKEKTMKQIQLYLLFLEDLSTILLLSNRHMIHELLTVFQY